MMMVIVMVMVMVMAILMTIIMIMVAMVVFWQHIVRRLSLKAFAKLFSIQNGP